MNTPKNTVQELRKERYAPSNIDGLTDASPRWVDILNRVESMERIN